MMFKKWHITGRNKITRIIAGVLAAVLFSALPAAAAKPTDFTDLDPKEWYYKEVSGAINAGLFNGDSPTYFNVDGNITRAEFVTALSRLCGVTEEGVKAFAKTGLTDVAATDWFYHYVGWAYANGVSDGKSPTEFDPEAPITREEISKMLGSTVERVFKKTLTTEGAATFTDQAKISDWAVQWVQKCNVAKIFLGDDEGKFNPGDPATRAEAAVVFYRCYINDEIMPKEEEPVTPPEPLDPAAYSVTVSGFDLAFDVNTDYYLVQSANFSNCKITGYTGFTDLAVSVEHYASYYPYKTTPYKLGDNLNLGRGRAKVTLTGTLPNGSTKEYLIAIADVGSINYAYARARVTGTVNLRAEPNTTSKVLDTLVNNARVYYLRTEGDWCLVEQLYTGKVGYIHKDYLRWGWLETAMPNQYRPAIDVLQAAHPNWTFSFVDVEMTYNDALAKYGADKAEYINPLNYLTEDKIFAMLDIDTYDKSLWNDAGIEAIWTNETAISKADAVSYFNQASASLLMNPYYIACRAALEGGYGTSKYASGMDTVSSAVAKENLTLNGQTFETGKTYTNVNLGGTFYNMYGIGAYDSSPNWCMIYAANRKWNSVFRAIVEGANWVKDQYLDQGAVTPYFFRYAGFQNKSYMSDAQAPLKEASILKRAYTDPNAKAHFIIPVYRELPTA